jgi:hypothetical protein
MKKIAVLVVACMCALLLTMCMKDKPITSGSSQVAVRLKDAPSGLCQNARLEIKGIKIFVNGAWVSVPMNDTILDILQLHDTSALMGTIHIGAGVVTKVDITLGSADTVTVNGVDYILTLTTTDIIIAVNDTLAPNGNFTITIDINAAQSIWDADAGGTAPNYEMGGTATCGFRRDG